MLSRVFVFAMCFNKVHGPAGIPMSGEEPRPIQGTLEDLDDVLLVGDIACSVLAAQVVQNWPDKCVDIRL